MTDDVHLVLPPEAEGDGLLFWSRLQYILEQSVRALPEDDREQRVAWCQETGNHGVGTKIGETDDELVFSWGGRVLARVFLNVFNDDSFFEPLESTLRPGPPD